MSEYLESPPSFNFISFLVCLGNIIADIVTLDSEIRPQPRIYALLLGESADTRKSTAANRAIEFFKSTITDFNVCFGVGSAEGLQTRLEKSPRLLLCFDEFKAFISKCRLDGSVLLPCTTSLFESNHYESQTKNSKIELKNIFLSILAASTCETYESTWDRSFTDIGFSNRLFIVPGNAERKFAIPKVIPDSEKIYLGKKLSDVLRSANANRILNITDEARAIFNKWYLGTEKSIHSKRLDTYALRFMPLLAINEQKSKIDVEIIEKIICLMNWQLQVRKLYAPFDADNKVAQLEERIRRNLTVRPLTERDLKKSIHYERYGLWLFNQARKNLQSSREIFFDKDNQKWTIAKQI
ncbi:MAG: hypothetical protein A2Y81_12720 [Nitrospirae bacterium RBG_13_43_8]|nr:MAG: hypothetical protein A2Y81_12720 [Nitrospirae bacterium RBG_13_43_8]